MSEPTTQAASPSQFIITGSQNDELSVIIWAGQNGVFDRRVATLTFTKRNLTNDERATVCTAIGKALGGFVPKIGKGLQKRRES